MHQTEYCGISVNSAGLGCSQGEEATGKHNPILQATLVLSLHCGPLSKAFFT